jgi:NADP-dependent 3-hydroxy acid dehydrogenase YdfG
VPADITSRDQAARVVHETAARFGGLDIVVNNAGVMLPAPFETADPAEWERSFALNVLAAMYVTQAALPHLRARRGRLVNIASIAGRETRSLFAAYDASKFAVVGLSDALRREVHRDGVKVSVIEPGAVATELVDNIGDEQVRCAAEQYVGSLEPMQPEDAAAAVLYIVSQPPRVQVNELLMRPTAGA